jgi:glycosyltransferase involved in cell wall biosynthesis
MKILQIVPSISLVYGGPSQMVLGLSAALARLGEEVTIITTDSNGDSGQPPLDVPLGIAIEQNGYQIRHFRCSPFRRYKFSLDLFSWLHSQAHNYDIAHIHCLFSPVSSISASIARFHHLPYLLRPLGTLDPADLRKKRQLKKLYTAFLEKPNIAGSAGIHFTSDQECRISDRFGVKTTDIVIPLGVELPREAINPRQSLDIPDDKPVILYMSRLDPKKGLDILLPSLQTLLDKGIDFHFVLAGGNPQDPDYEKRIQTEFATSLDKHCTIAGFVTGGLKRGLLEMADIFVLPSYYENFGIAVAEAMAVGTPVVISDGVDLHPAVQQTESGWITSPTREGLTLALETALQDAGERQCRGDNARQLAQDRYSWDSIARKMLAVYEKYR